MKPFSSIDQLTIEEIIEDTEKFRTSPGLAVPKMNSLRGLPHQSRNTLASSSNQLVSTGFALEYSMEYTTRVEMH